MATSDLLAELQKESFKPDTDGEKKICRAILKLLNDSSSDVQGLAVKWSAAPSHITTPELRCEHLVSPINFTAASRALARR